MQRTTYAPTPQIGFRPRTPSINSGGGRPMISKTQGRAILPGCTSNLVSQAYNFFGKPVGLRTGGGDERGTIQIATTEYNYRVGHNINELGARVFATDTFYVGDTEVRAIYFRKGQKVSDPVFEIVDSECPAILSQRQLAQALQAGELAYYSGGKEVKPKAFLNALHELMLAQPARDVTKEYVADMQEAVLSTFVPIAENLRRNRAGRQFFKDLVDCVQQEYPTTHEALAEIRHDYICRQRLPGNTPLYKLVRGLEGELESDGIVERAWQEFDGAIPSRQELRGKISEIARRETLEEPAKPNFVKQVASYAVAGLFGLAAWAVVKDISGEPGSWGAAAADSGSDGLPASGRGAAEPTIPSDLDKISPVTISDIINFTYGFEHDDTTSFPQHLTNNGIIFENAGKIKFYDFRTNSVTTLPTTSGFSLMAAERNAPDGANLAQLPTLWNRFTLSGKFLFGNNTIMDAETGIRMLGITADEVYQPNLRDANGNQIFVLRDTTVSPPKLVYFQISPAKQYLSSPNPQGYDPDAALQSFVFGCGDKVVASLPDGNISSFKFVGTSHQTLTVLKKPKGTLQELFNCRYVTSYNDSSGYHHISRFDSFGNPVGSIGFVDLGFNLTSPPLYLGEDWFLITGPSPYLANDKVAKQLLNAKTKQTVDLTALAGGPLLSQKVSYIGHGVFLYSSTNNKFVWDTSFIFKPNKTDAALRNVSNAITWDGRGHYLLATDPFSAYFGIFDKLFKIPTADGPLGGLRMNSGWLTWLGTDSKVHYANLSALDTRLGYSSILTNFTKPAGPQPGQPSGRFVHLSDTHVGASGADTRLGQMVGKILTFKPKPDFVVVSGDVADAGADSNSNYLRFLQLVKPLEDAGVRVLTVPGNHDYRASNDVLGSSPYVGGLESLFDQRLNTHRSTLGDRNIAGKVVDKGQYVLIGLDSGHDRVADVLAIDLAPEGSGLSAAQINWLGNTLDGLDGVQDGKDTSGKAKIIVMHHPAFGGAKEIFHGETIANYKTEFLALLKKYGVDVVLSGHTHRNFFGLLDSTKHVQTASTAYEGAWRNISIQNGAETVFVPNVLSKMVRVKTGSPVELQAYRSGMAVMPQVSSMFSVDGKDSVQREISVDYAPGLEFKVIGTSGAVPGATYKLEIALNSETNETPVVFMSGVPIVSGTTHTYSVDWNKVASSDARAVALRYKTAEGREVAFTLPPFVTGTQFEAALKAAQSRISNPTPDGNGTQTPKSPASTGVDWRVPVGLGLLGGGAAVGYSLWQRGRGGEELPETQTPIAPRREALRRRPVDVPRPAIPRRPRAALEPQTPGAHFFGQMDTVTPRAQPQPSIAATQEPKIRWDLSDEAAAQIGRVLPKAVRQDGEGLFVMATEEQMARIKALVKAKDGEEE